jgi:hypothetical protein
VQPIGEVNEITPRGISLKYFSGSGNLNVVICFRHVKGEHFAVQKVMAPEELGNDGNADVWPLHRGTKAQKK